MTKLYQERKYRVESFIPIKRRLEQLGIAGSKLKKTSHYYRQYEGNDVIKLISNKNKNKIVHLKENKGKFDLIESIQMESLEDGLNWMKEKGYSSVGLVKMENVDYKYKNGLVRLYIIDDWLYTVILKYPKGEHKSLESDLLLGKAETVKVPYNKLLKQLGKLKIIKLD